MPDRQALAFLRYRKGWCEAVAVRSHAYEDSLGEGALAATAKEQQKGKGDFPGPHPSCFSQSAFLGRMGAVLLLDGIWIRI